MTAIVGVMNKAGVAIAADSAVTVTSQNDRKIYNQAKKIFTLSKIHPIGIMIYNSAALMNTPWEIIIKLYREQLKDKCFDKVEDYIVDFLDFLKKNDYFCSTEIQKVFFQLFLASIVDEIFKKHINKISKDISTWTADDKLNFQATLQEDIQQIIQNLITNTNNTICPTFDNFSIEDFTTSSLFDVVNTIFQKLEGSINFELDISVKEQFILLFYQVLQRNIFFNNFTGLVFVGYGDKEIYPSLIPINVSFAFDDKLRFAYDTNKKAQINDFQSQAICPFAQTDVMDTILTGIDPLLHHNTVEAFEKFLSEFKLDIGNIVNTIDVDLANGIKNLDLSVIVSNFATQLQQLKQQNYIYPLMSTIGSLSKEDMAEMAESLIYLTYLKRRITNAEESVGGPVDVAIISKGDGFIWIKRKHYFQPELNQHFFANYFKNIPT